MAARERCVVRAKVRSCASDAWVSEEDDLATTPCENSDVLFAESVAVAVMTSPGDTPAGKVALKAPSPLASVAREMAPKKRAPSIGAPVESGGESKNSIR